MSAGVYKITNLVNGKVYIGMSVDMDNRKAQHFGCKSGAPKLVNAIKKYGASNFAFEPVFELIEGADVSDLHKFEAQLIESYNAVASGYNIFPASRGLGAHGPEWAAQCKERASNPALRKRYGSPGELNPMFGKSRKGHKVGGAVTPMVGEKNPMFGRSWKIGKTDEELAAHAQKSARAGSDNGCYGVKFYWINNGVSVKRLPDGEQVPDGWALGFLGAHILAAQSARKRKVRCVNTGAVYSSLSEASSATGAQQSKITLCCQGKRKQTNGLSWEYC